MNDTFEETLWEAARNKALAIGDAWNLLDQAGNYIERLQRELAEARAEGLEQARLLGISGSREARLLAEIERLKEALEWYVSCRARELLKENP